MYTYPERKKYIYKIPTTKGDLILRFEQATARETKDYYDLIDMIQNWDIINKYSAIKELSKYYLDFIEQKCDKKWYNIRKRKVVSLVKKELGSYIDELVSMLHPTRKSVYKNTDTPKINGKKPRPNIFPNDLDVIHEKTGIPTDQIYDRLTMEQIWWYLDKVVFWFYEQFDEGKKINDRLTRKDWWLTEQDKKDLEFIKSQKR